MAHALATERLNNHLGDKKKLKKCMQINVRNCMHYVTNPI